MREHQLLDSVVKAVDGLLVGRFRDLDSSLRSNVTQYDYMGYRQSDDQNLFNAFDENLNLRVDAIVGTVKSVLASFQTPNPSTRLGAAVSSYAGELLAIQVTQHRRLIKEFQRKSGVTWPEVNDEASINAAMVALNGKLELLLRAPRHASAAERVVGVTGEPRGQSTHVWNALKPLLPYIMGGLGLLVQNLYWRDKLADKDRRVVEQQTLVRELLPLIDSLVASDSKTPDAQWERLLGQFSGRMSVRNRLLSAFGLPTAALYDSAVSELRERRYYYYSLNQKRMRGELSNGGGVNLPEEQASRLQSALITGIGK